MKTIEELKDEGLISNHLYTSLIRGIGFDEKFMIIRKPNGWKKLYLYPDGNKLTVNDILELWTEKEILHWRGIGKKSFEELKSLA